MHFIIGTALLVTAIVLLGAARFAVAHLEESALVRKFAATEVTALTITALSAFGIGFLANGIAADDSAAAMGELGAAVGLIVLSAVATIRLTRRRTPATSAALHRAAA